MDDNKTTRSGSRSISQNDLAGLYEDPFDVGCGIEVGHALPVIACGNGYATAFTRFSLQFAHEGLRFAEVSAFSPSRRYCIAKCSNKDACRS